MLYETDDVSDWLQAGGEQVKLIEICREVPTSGFPAIEPYKFPAEADIEPWDFLYGNHLLRGRVALTSAPKGTGKSSKLVVEALAMTADRALVGVKPATRRDGMPLRVLIVSLEDLKDDVDKRIAAAKKHYGLSDRDIGDRLIVWAREKGSRAQFDFNIATYVRPGVIKPNEELIDSLIERIIENEIDVVLIDPLRMTHSVPENDNSGMGRVIELFAQVAAEADCAVHLWHHTRKGNGGETTIEAARGASAIVDVPRSVEIGSKMTSDEASKMGVEHHRRGFYFSTYGVANFAPPIERRQWFELKNVDLMNAIPGDSVGVVATWNPPSVEAAALSPEQVARIVTEIGFTPRWREDVRASMWVGKAVAQALGLSHEADREQVKGVLARLLQTRVLKMVTAPDERRKPKPFIVAA